MNETIRKFGYPATLLRELDHWVILLRPTQPTLGSLVLAAKADVTDFAALPDAAFAEMKLAITAIERSLKSFVDYAKINYLMLMMVDPNVHYHVIPRYEGSREFNGVTYTDAGWPKVPDLGSAVALNDGQITTLREALAPRLT